MISLIILYDSSFRFYKCFISQQSRYIYFIIIQIYNAMVIIFSIADFGKERYKKYN